MPDALRARKSRQSAFDKGDEWCGLRLPPARRRSNCFKKGVLCKILDREGSPPGVRGLADAFGPPARAAAKVSTADALSGPSGSPRPPSRVAVVGLLVLVTGGLLTAWGTQTDLDIPLAGGLIAMLSGFLLSIPLLVALAGRIASRLPMTGRLAARDAARHGRRTGAAVAAAAIALSVTVAVSTYSLSKETYERRSRPLGADQLLIGELGSAGVGIARSAAWTS